VSEVELEWITSDLWNYWRMHPRLDRSDRLVDFEPLAVIIEGTRADMITMMDAHQEEIIANRDGTEDLHVEMKTNKKRRKQR
jgi:hypothetical protein